MTDKEAAELVAEKRFSTLCGMADVSRAVGRVPARKRVLRDLAHREDGKRLREAAHQRLESRAALLHLREAGLAVARRPAWPVERPALLRLVRMPRECIPEHDAERRAGALDLAPDHVRAALALRFYLRVTAGERERASGHEVSLLQDLRLRAKRDAREAAAAVAGSLAEKHHSRARAARLEVGRHVLAPMGRHLAARGRVTLVAVPPGIEDARGLGWSVLEDAEEVFDRAHRAEGYLNPSAASAAPIPKARRQRPRAPG